MSEEELKEVVHQRPFQPFRIIITTGETYDIHHPDLIMVGRRSAILGFTNEPNGTSYERTVRIDLLHIVGIQELPAPPPVPANSSMA